MRVMIALVMSVVIGFGCVAALIRVPGLITVENTSRSSQVRAGGAQKPKTSATADASAGRKRTADEVRISAAGGKKIENSSQTGDDQIEETLKSEESVQLRSWMKVVVESFEKMRKKIGL
jgi:hypothetical protein